MNDGFDVVVDDDNYGILVGVVSILHMIDMLMVCAQFMILMAMPAIARICSLRSVLIMRATLVMLVKI